MDWFTITAAGGLLTTLGFIGGLLVGRWQPSSFANQLRETRKLVKEMLQRVDEFTVSNLTNIKELRRCVDSMQSTLNNKRFLQILQQLDDDHRTMRGEIDKIRGRRAGNAAGGAHASYSQDGCIDYAPQMQRQAMGHRQSHRRNSRYDSAPRKQRAVAPPANDLENHSVSKPHLRESVEEALERLHDKLQAKHTFERMGYATIDRDSDRVVAVWHRSHIPPAFVSGYAQPLSKSSLQYVAKLKRPRVLNDLEEYLEKHPASHSTRLLVKDGYRSSLTYPILVDDEVYGFLFFTRTEKNFFEGEVVVDAKGAAEELGAEIARAELELIS